MKTSEAQQPNPVPVEAVRDPEEAGNLRRLKCMKYNACLDLALKQGWPGFGCGECNAYEERSRAHLRLDLEGLAALLQQAFRDDEDAPPAPRVRLPVRRGCAA